MRISEILHAKGGSVFTMRPTDRVSAALDVFHEREFGAIVIHKVRGDLLGILTERDVIHDLSQNGAATLDKQVGEIMSKLRTCTPEDKVQDVMHMMTLKRVRHVAVVDDDKLVGIISIGDLVKFKLNEAQLEVDTMRDFVRTH